METTQVFSPQLSNSDRFNSIYEKLKDSFAHSHKPTAEHSIRVRICATSLGLTLGLKGKDLTNLCIAAEFHDIGKLQIPLEILNKKEQFSKQELEILKLHPMYGSNIASSAFPFVEDIAECILQHHEKLDGSGYPNALTSNKIGILSRILAVADTYITLNENISFRNDFSNTHAVQILMTEERNKYDQAVVKALAHMILSN